jgi:hypothetical protein
MAISNLQRQQAEDQANETQLRLYAEPEAGEQLWSIATKYVLTEQSVYYIFVQLVGDVILGFYKQSDISTLIATKLPQVQGAQRIALEADIRIFLYPLVESTHITSAKISAAPEPELSAEIKTAENELASLQAVRTMTSDMRALGHADDVPVYRSLQEDILAPTSPTDTPATPRWESESTR